MTFEKFEVERQYAARRLENELIKAGLARYDVDAEIVISKMNDPRLNMRGPSWDRTFLNPNRRKSFLAKVAPDTTTEISYATGTFVTRTGLPEFEWGNPRYCIVKID